MDMMINGQNYPITGIIEDDALGPIPIIDLHLMSDYDWHVSCLKSRLENLEAYREMFGGDVEAVIDQLRATIAEYEKAVMV